MGKAKSGGKAKQEPSVTADAKPTGTCNLVTVRHILCEKQSKTLEALKKIQEGERFETVAQQYSEDAARKGGDLGWKRRNELVGPFADAAFELQVNQMTPEPIKTKFGYHLILCEGRKN